LQDSDLYCYETESKEKLKFMHSLIGSFVIDTIQNDPEMIEGQLHRKLEIKISEFFKRIFYIPCKIPREIGSGGDVQFGNPSSFVGTNGILGQNESILEEEYGY
jgi:hypothetical protein